MFLAFHMSVEAFARKEKKNDQSKHLKHHTCLSGMERESAWSNQRGLELEAGSYGKVRKRPLGAVGGRKGWF